MDYYDQQSHMYGTNAGQEEKVNKGSSVTLSIAKVFLYMFAGLLITALVAFGVGALVYYKLEVDPSDVFAGTYLWILVGSGIALIIDVIVINFVTLRGKHSILIPAIIYCVLVGVLFSMLTVFVEWELIGMAFGITALSFLVMGAIAFLTKGSLAPLAVMAIGLFVGAGLLALVNWIYMIATGTVFNTLYWVVTFAIFAAIMLITMYDMWRMKKIAEAGQLQGNLALYCAFTMYVDFINIFIRILYFLILIYGKKK